MDTCKKKCLKTKGICLILAAVFSLLTARGQTPVISSFSPAVGVIGSSVTINGANFSSTPSGNIVYFGGVRAHVSDATVNTLTVTVPDGATPQPISVTTNNLTAFSSKPFITTFPGGSAGFISSSFVNTASLTTGLHPYGIFAADLDGDGKLDLVTPNNANTPNPASISILLNMGNSGSLVFASEFDLSAPSGSYPDDIIAADIDGDGKLDLVFSSVLSNTVSVYRNTSTPGMLSFAARQDFSTGANPSSVAIGDLDGDGKPDLVVTNFLSGTISLFINTSTSGSIAFKPKADLATDLGPQTVVIGDLDGDGKPDLVVTNSFSSSLSLYRNKSSPGTLTFAAKADIATGPDEPFGLAIADLDGDGKPDLVMTNDNFNQVNAASVSLSLFRNTSSPGNFAFSAQVNLGKGDAFNPAIGDLNGDGKPDLVLPTGNSSLLIYPNISTPGHFALGNPVSYYEVTPYSVAIADLNGDGLPDLAAANFTTNSITAYKSAATSPAISRFFPEVALVGASDTIIGANFTGATAVIFGTGPAASFTVVSDSMIIAVIGTGVISPYSVVSVTTPRGTVTAADGFTLAGIPTISSVYPNSLVQEGSTVTIYGSGFAGVTNIKFGGVSARSFTVNNIFTTINAIVDTGATGDITVTTPGGTADFPGFSFQGYEGGIITSFSPTSGTAGTTVTISGNNFVINAESVSFGGVPAATVSVVNKTTLQAVVGNGASGNITVSDIYGTKTGGSFTYTGPFISSLVPAYGGSGTSVVLKGENFTGATSVSFGGIAAASFTVADSSTIDAVVGTGDSGTIQVVTPTGTATVPGFIFSTSPAIAYLSPSLGGVGTTLTISGSNFDANPSEDAVVFGSVKAAVISATANTMVVKVPPGITYQPLSVISNGQVATARNPFDVTFNGAGPVFTPNYFGGPLNLSVRPSPHGIVICDFDGDGRPDLAAGCVDAVSVIRNTSESGFLTFGPRLDLPATYTPQFIAAGDIDGDGKPDLVAAEYSTVGGSISLYRNTSMSGSISFAPKINMTLAGAWRVVVQDLDGDGKADLLVVCSFPNSNIYLFRNTSSMGNISFAQPLIFNTDLTGGASAVVVSDLDGDGRPDMAFLGGTWLRIFKNVSTPGTIAVQDVDGVIPAGISPLDIAVGDVDGDGRPDLLVADPAAGYECIHLFPNTSTMDSLSFGSSQTILAPANSGPWGITLNDMDGDGKPDLVVTNEVSQTVSVYKNASTPGTFSFSSPVDHNLGNYPNYPWSSLTGDLDGDGKPEIVTSHDNGTDSSVHILTILKNMIGIQADVPSILVDSIPIICQGDSVLLNSSAPANNQWYKDGQAISGAVGPSLWVQDSGVYTVTAFFPPAISLPSAGDTITVKPAPAQPSVTLLPASQGLMSSADSGNQWYMDTTNLIPAATSQIYKPADSGYYGVRVTLNGCPSPFSDAIFYHLPPIDTTSATSGRAIAAPNPFVTGLVRIIYNFSGINTLSAELSDINGKVILTQPNLLSGDYLDLSRVQKGIYALKLFDSSGKRYATISILKI
jgi:hypothetical protein